MVILVLTTLLVVTQVADVVAGSVDRKMEKAPRKGKLINVQSKLRFILYRLHRRFIIPDRQQLGCLMSTSFIMHQQTKSLKKHARRFIYQQCS